jgi:Tfp pilus assembly protein PilZ
VEDRRKEARQHTTLVVQVESPDGTRGPRVGITRDASPGGLLLGCSTAYQVGQEIVLVLQREENEAPTRVRCSVVRVQPNPNPSSAFWLYLVALRFLEPTPQLDTMIEEALHAQRAQNAPSE